MSPRPSWAAAIAFGLSLAVPVHAQSPARPDPLDAAAEVPRAAHRSALAGYRPAGPVEVGSWQAANERVARIGGWRVYAREAGEPAPDGASRPAAAPAPSAPSAAPGAAPERPLQRKEPGHGTH